MGVYVFGNKYMFFIASNDGESSIALRKGMILKASFDSVEKAANRIKQLYGLEEKLCTPYLINLDTLLTLPDIVR